jgi:hypothetical protein
VGAAADSVAAVVVAAADAAAVVVVAADARNLAGKSQNPNPKTQIPRRQSAPWDFSLS